MKLKLFLFRFRPITSSTTTCYWPEGFRTITSYWPEGFRTITCYWPEGFRTITCYWPEGFRTITLSIYYILLKGQLIFSQNNLRRPTNSIVCFNNRKMHIDIEVKWTTSWKRNMTVIFQFELSPTVIYKVHVLGALFFCICLPYKLGGLYRETIESLGYEHFNHKLIDSDIIFRLLTTVYELHCQAFSSPGISNSRFLPDHQI